jgi:hypothetical protein
MGCWQTLNVRPICAARRSQASKRQAVHGLVEALESRNPLPNSVQHLDRVAGDWRLLYTTITITVSTQSLLHSSEACPRLWAEGGGGDMP